MVTTASISVHEYVFRDVGTICFRLANCRYQLFDVNYIGFQKNGNINYYIFYNNTILQSYLLGLIEIR